MTTRVFLDIHIGDQATYTSDLASYERTCSLLLANNHTYGLPPKPDDLSEEQRDILADLNRDKSFCLRFNEPTSLLAGRLTFLLNPSPGLVKTRNNFISLCNGDKGMCKNAPNKALHYLNTPIHRIVKGFVAQGGDITRGDGSGGESIYGGKFNDEKEGLKKDIPIRRGSLAMANSGKNANTSQFFVVLAEDDASLAKIRGKYVVFGELVEGEDVLARLDALSALNGIPLEKVWVGGCGIIE